MSIIKAPEKIKIGKHNITSDGDVVFGWVTNEPDCEVMQHDVEYVRTDAFIEKACKWLKESITNNAECNRIISKKGVITMGLLIEDFRTYMKGE